MGEVSFFGLISAAHEIQGSRRSHQGQIVFGDGREIVDPIHSTATVGIAIGRQSHAGSSLIEDEVAHALLPIRRIVSDLSRKALRKGNEIERHLGLSGFPRLKKKRTRYST